MANKGKNENKSDKKFFKELKAELKKVTWPTSKELVTNTSAVISIVLILAIIVFVLDVCFEKINNLGVSGVQKIVSSVDQNQEEIVEQENGDAEPIVEINPENVEVVTETEEETSNTEEVTE